MCLFIKYLLCFISFNKYTFEVCAWKTSSCNFFPQMFQCISFLIFHSTPYGRLGIFIYGVWQIEHMLIFFLPLCRHFRFLSVGLQVWLRNRMLHYWSIPIGIWRKAIRRAHMAAMDTIGPRRLTPLKWTTLTREFPIFTRTSRLNHWILYISPLN